MGILGLTHDESGVALEKLPVAIKVAIGEAPEPGNQNSHPRRLDHFVFKRKTLRGQEVVWEPAPDITEAHAARPTELGIVFLHDDTEEILRTEYAWWTAAGCKCRGELVQIANGNGTRYEMRAIRKTRQHPEGEAWPGQYRYAGGPKKDQPYEPCGGGCPDLERGDCRPSGDLYFMLEKFPKLGAVCRLHTSSYRSVRNLSNGLMQIRRFHGNRLAGVKALLRATPEKIWYKDQSGTRHSSVVYILSLEISAREIGRAPGFDSDLQFVVRESDDERASEISNEFYSEGRWTADEHFASPDNIREQDEQSARICEFACRLGYREVQTKMLLGQWAANLAGLERRLLNELDQQTERASTPPDNEFGRQEKLNQPPQVGRAQASTPTEEPFSVEGFPV
jgi:Recombination directionality factor-like